jgi:hypothetical protein
MAGIGFATRTCAVPRRAALSRLIRLAILACTALSTACTQSIEVPDATAIVPSDDASGDAVTTDAVALEDADDTSHDASGTDDTPIVTGSFDPDVAAHIHDLIVAGAARGNRTNVFAKLGDSITESRAFLYACGSGHPDLGSHDALFETMLFFREVNVDPDFNSFERPSLAASGGWTTEDALEGGDGCPVVQEIEALHPQWAIVMFGTNDLERDGDVGVFTTRMNTIVDLLEARAVVAVLTTIPPRLDSTELASRVGAYNDAIRSIASTRRIPLVDYWAALQPIARNGLDDDGIHPSAYFADGYYDACNLTDAGLQYGYDVRNLVSVDMLARLRDLVR